MPHRRREEFVAEVTARMSRVSPHLSAHLSAEAVKELVDRVVGVTMRYEGGATPTMVERTHRDATDDADSAPTRRSGRAVADGCRPLRCRRRAAPVIAPRRCPRCGRRRRRGGAWTTAGARGARRKLQTQPCVEGACAPPSPTLQCRAAPSPPRPRRNSAPRSHPRRARRARAYSGRSGPRGARCRSAGPLPGSQGSTRATPGAVRWAGRRPSAPGGGRTRRGRCGRRCSRSGALRVLRPAPRASCGSLPEHNARHHATTLPPEPSMNTPRPNAGAPSTDQLPHRTDGDDAGAAHRAAEAEAVRRAAERPSHAAVEGEQSGGPTPRPDPSAGPARGGG